MALQAVKVDGESLLNAALDTLLLNPPNGVGIMQADGVHARVIGIGVNGEVKVDYPEAVKPGDMVIVRNRTDW